MVAQSQSARVLAQYLFTMLIVEAVLKLYLNCIVTDRIELMAHMRILV